MTEFQPKPQTHEEVADGLRNAFRQAIKDGVMDATPYLKQMTFNTDIQKTEKEIAVLQKKLELLKEIETHKSQPRMNFELGGKFEIVSYNGENYYRLEFDDESHSWYKRREKLDGNLLKLITDGETHRLLDGLWFNEVRKGKYDDVVDEPEHYDEVEWDEKDNPKPMNEVLDRLENKWNSATENSASYITDEVVNRMLKKWEENPPEFLKFELGETLETRIYKWWTTCYSKHWTIDECTADLLDIVELFLPREQSAEGSQNINTEVAVEAHNELLQKIKSKLRNKK
jgi:hypothetical protein